MSPSDPQLLVEVLVRNARGQILVVYNIDNWWLPTGKVEPGESLGAAAIREVMEETGVPIHLGGVLAVEEQETEQRRQLWIAFAAVAKSEQIVLEDPDGKVTDARWVDEAEAGRLLPSRKQTVGFALLADGAGVAYVDLLE